MKKLNFLFFISFAILLIAACSKFEADPEYLNLNDDVTLKSVKINPLPFKSVFKLWSDSATPGPTINLTVNGLGNATHMGNTTLLVNETISTTTIPWTAHANVILTAANGDELHFDYDSVIDPSGMAPGGNFDLIVVGLCTITGGTGRFEDASGNLIYNGIFNVATSTGKATFIGDIMY